MAYPVSEDWKEMVYGDKTSYTYSLSINGNNVPTAQIENMKISNATSIIKTRSK